jgi:REP element-mobilizing transposase RayT
MKQLKLFNKKNAGRPKIPLHKRGYVPHRKREKLPAKTPIHATIKIRSNIVQTLRNKIVFKKISKAILRARVQGLRIIHFTVQKDHLHLLIETHNNKELAKGMQALGISLAKSLKNLTKVKGPIYKERYHLHILKTVQEIKNVKAYILGNAHKHGVIKDHFDTFSSVIKVPEIAWQFNFEKYFKDLVHFLDYEKIISDLIDPPKFYLTRKYAT